MIEVFFETLSLVEPCMDVPSQTSIKVTDSSAHYSTENAYSQVTSTYTVRFFGSPKPLFAVQVNMPASVLLMFGIFSSFLSGNSLVFPWFPDFSLVHVMVVFF